MKPTRIGVLAMVFGIVLLTTGAEAAGAGPSATGSGYMNIEGSSGGRRTFAFNAVQHQDGSVTGQAQLYNRGGDSRMHITLDCLEIRGNGELAVMSGTIESATHSQFVGRIAVFGAWDTGEGHDAADRLTFLATFAQSSGANCHTVQPEDYYEIDGGNIQVNS